MLDAVASTFAPHPLIHTVPNRRIRNMAAFRAMQPVLEAALGVALPASRTRIVHRGADILWNGPRQWLVLGELELPVNCAAITEQTDGLFLFSISGPHAVTILKKILPIDVARFAADEVAITAAAHIGVHVWRQDENFILGCFRSYSGALHHVLMQAADTFTERG